MIANPIKPRKALNKAFLKVKPYREDIEIFKKNLIKILDFADDSESEEYHKNLVSGFLKDSLYHNNYFINTSGRSDQVIHVGPKPDSAVGVIIEAKNAKNNSEMVSIENLNKKAFHELLLYFLRERITKGNLEVKNLIITNLFEWFIFDANSFEKGFVANKSFVKKFKDFEAGNLSGTNTDFFYNEIAKPFMAEYQGSFSFVYFDLRKYEKIVRNDDSKDDLKLVSLFKVLSPEHLLKLPFENDSNSLDKKFYTELLHIIGLTEVKKGSKKLIQRNEEDQRNLGSLLENTIIQLESRDKISRLPNAKLYGENKSDQLFNVGLELVITWVNRILFLKLLEAQLIRYHKSNNRYAFLNLKMIKDYDDLDSLFFQVLAKKHEERNEESKRLFGLVPYLNSSLFEPTDIEHDTIFVSNLRDDKPIPIISSTVLKNENGKKRSGELSTLEYLFVFLDAYDFSSEGAEDIQEDNKTLINASVLGLIFEKINGYKDGSFFTPGFITMYMCRETIRKAVVQKFNEVKNWKCKDLDEVYDNIEDRNEANSIVNSLKICDPAVGSGHFLVSALNELIAIKNDLRIFQDIAGKRLKEYEVEVVNDELVITDDEGELFEYHPNNKESQRVQMALFHEKQNLIENSLFGVDINPNSVKICRLRLWIELLKNAYYKGENELETLPNIDINIKTGNSLISRFALDDDLTDAFKDKKITYSFLDYKQAVTDYKNTASKEKKREILNIINEVKNNFRSTLDNKFIAKFQKAQGLLINEQERQNNLKTFEQRITKTDKEKLKKLQKRAEKALLEKEEIVNNVIYENAFEWRFEFPEVLNDEGDYVGFDVVIGNPPYFSMSKLKAFTNYYEKAGFQTYSKGADVYCLFYEIGGRILKDKGLLTYITSNSWLRAIYGELLKEYFLENLQPISLLNIEDIQLFEEATVESNIITLKKGSLTDSFPVVNLSDDYVLGASLSEYFEANHFEFAVPESSEWFIGNQAEGNLKAKIEKQGKQLKNFDIRINFGIKTGYNEAFIIDEQKKVNLINLDRNNQDIIKPILRGRDLKKYSYEFEKVYLINSHNGLKSSGLKRIDVENDYPIIYKHLRTFLPKVQSRYDQGDHWSNLRNCSYLEDFDKPKIIWGEISDKPKFAFDDKGLYAEATTFLMTGEKLKFLLAILNSKLSEWYFNLIGTTTGMGTNRWKKYKIELLPVKVPSEDEILKIETIVDNILNLKNEDSSNDTSFLENQIDQLVYQLYELSKEEIAIINS
ncbi:TaqI-like C-terminal specificity domain-containing protein [uncultured Croceitalea sp.]|uniref:class I SAM-dependent DNA methyltransferase n=1 Tax=uncultured Croceitalea sp. TaxID=1798908 RepID=UPI0033066749